MMAESIDQIVERRIREWELRLRQSAAPTVFHPIVTISRQSGAGGVEVARAVAERLRFALYDRELVEAVARNSRVLDAIVEEVDERTRTAIEAGVREILTGTTLTYGDYISQLGRVVLHIVRQGQAVILGRGAHHIIEGRYRLAVRLVAPLDKRVQRKQQLMGTSAEEARAEVLRVDRERQAFAQLHFSADDDNPMSYDLVVNTGSMSMHEAADIIAHAYDVRFGKR
jgi:cytidylate kinase